MRREGERCRDMEQGGEGCTMKGTCTCDGGDEGTNVLAGIQQSRTHAYKHMISVCHTKHVFYYVVTKQTNVT